MLTQASPILAILRYTLDLYRSEIVLDLQPQGYNVGHKATRVRIDSTLHRSSIITVCNHYLRTKTLLILIDLYYTTSRVYHFRITGATYNFQFYESSTTSVKPLCVR